MPCCRFCLQPSRVVEMNSEHLDFASKELVDDAAVGNTTFFTNPPSSPVISTRRFDCIKAR